MAIIQSDVLALACGSASCCCPALRQFSLSFTSNIPIRRLTSRVFSTCCSPASSVKLPEKPLVCTADELHYVTVQNSDWRLALWRYLPSRKAPVRSHPLLLLSGVGTNAIGYDLSPECSFARSMSNNGYDTWILEVRGAGLSLEASNVKDIQRSSTSTPNKLETVASIAKDPERGLKNTSTNNFSNPSTSESENRREIATAWDESKLISSLSDTFMRLSETLSGFVNEAQLNTMFTEFLDQISTLLEDTQLSESLNDIRVRLQNLIFERENSGIGVQIRNLCERLVHVIEEGQRSVSPPFLERLFSTVENFQRQLDVIVKYNWDFDNFLEEDIPAVMEYIKQQTEPNDGKLLAIGHSMGGILLYSMLSKYAYEGNEPGFVAIVTLASSLDYSSSDTKFKMLTPIVEPAQALNVPVLPLGTILAATFPLSARPPYVLSWLKYFISADNMMHPDKLEKLVMTNFCTIPMKLIFQLRTAMNEGGLRDRTGSFVYKDHLHKTTVPVLALAGDQDLICPPEAVEDTVKALPRHLVRYRIFGQDAGPHYAHYDLVGSKLAVDEIYPCVVEFLNLHDQQ